MSEQMKTSRRELLFKAAATIPAGFAVLAASKVMAAGGAAAPAAKPADAGLKFVPDTDPVAKALKYVPDATKAKREKRGATEGKDQHCSNCQLYVKQGEIGGKEAGKCTMIQTGMVAAAGWCASWSKKA
ncbi:MAG: high-potential iron-sulfur protein [Proteobacteria bacterium]|nr:high-potential iron-sulfur protein [Pseudomonadota bacterium]